MGVKRDEHQLPGTNELIEVKILDVFIYALQVM
jgi:hypothetical protein